MSYFPLRVNTAGVIPPIFASSLLIFPLHDRPVHRTRPRSNDFIQDYLNPGGWIYNLRLRRADHLLLPTSTPAIMINPADVADNIKSSGGYIPGIRPGKRTAEYIDHVLSRITLVGALYISAICVLPTLLVDAVRRAVLLRRHGAADRGRRRRSTRSRQIEAHLVSRQYEGFVQGARMRGRLGR